MTTEPFVSVLMTSYNREKYIAFAIESVLASTYKNFELLVVDDRSTDGTVDIVRKFEAQDSRVRLIINEKNLGDYPNRNCAASHANGEWLKYVDSDDYIYPTGLQVLVDMMEKFPEAGYGLCSIPQFIDSPFPICLSPREAYTQNYFHKPIFSKAPLSSIIRKSAWEAVGEFSPEKMTSDMDMWHRLAIRYTVVLMPLGIVWYRVHGEQEIADRDRVPIDYQIRYEAVTRRMLSDPDVPLSRDEKKAIAKRFAHANRKQAVKLILKGNLNDARKLIRNASDFRNSRVV